MKISLFCSEFVINCIQEGLAHLNRVLSEEEIRMINIRGVACSPMCFEGFLSVNEVKYGDWKRVGKLHGEFM